MQCREKKRSARRILSKISARLANEARAARPFRKNLPPANKIPAGPPGARLEIHVPRSRSLSRLFAAANRRHLRSLTHRDWKCASGGSPRTGLARGCGDINCRAWRRPAAVLMGGLLLLLLFITLAILGACPRSRRGGSRRLWELDRRTVESSFIKGIFS